MVVAPASSRTKDIKGTRAELKKRKCTPKQCPARKRNGMQKMKTQELIHVARVKQMPECVVGSNKLESNGKHVRERKVMDLYGSGACTQGSSTTYLYPANTREVSHETEVREGMVLQWGEMGSLFWDSRSSSFGGNVLLGWHLIQKR